MFGQVFNVWFAGFTPNYTATVWAGYDNNIKLSKEEESLAMIIWRQIMSNIPANKKASEFKMPSGITTAFVCPDSGLLAISGYCPHAYNEYFVKGTQPTTYCYVGQKAKKKAEDKKRREEEQRKKREEERRREEEEEEEERREAARKAAEKKKSSRDEEEDEEEEE